MPHIIYETISRRTDEELEAFDRKENDQFRRRWFFFIGRVLPTLVAITTIAGCATTIYYLGQ